jgi:hypothetical protein
MLNELFIFTKIMKYNNLYYWLFDNLLSYELLTRFTTYARLKISFKYLGGLK